MQIDLKLARIKAEKQRAKESQIVEEAQNMREKYSGLML